MEDRRIYPPPKISTPREAPWREVEEIIEGLKTVANKLDGVIAAFRGAPPPTLPTAPTRDTLYERLDLLIEKLDDLLRRPAGAPGLDGRLDEIAESTRNRPAWDHGQKDVVAAGTAEQLPDVPIPDGFEGVVRAKPGNTSDIYLGKSKSEATRSTSRITLAAGEAMKLRVQNFSLWFVDAAVSGEGVEYFVEKD